MARLVVELQGAQAERQARQLAGQMNKLGLSAQVVETRMSKVSGGLGRMAAGLGRMGVAAGAAAVALAAVVARKSIQAFEVQARAVAQLNAALESTGGIAGKTSRELQSAAAALQRATEFGDEAIMGIQSQLLTFTSIRGDVFDRTTEAVLNLSVRMDQDLRSSVVQLGKALNDPVANLGALSRSGIQFSETQKEMIKDLTASGRLLDAQTIILDELETQFGGAAEAARDAGSGMVPLQNAVGDLLEEVGAGLTPALRDMAKELEASAQDPATVEGFRQIGVALGEMARFGGMAVSMLVKLAVNLEAARIAHLEYQSGVLTAIGRILDIYGRINPIAGKALEGLRAKIDEYATAARVEAAQSSIELLTQLGIMGEAAEDAAEEVETLDTSTRAYARTLSTVKSELSDLTDRIEQHEAAVKKAETAIREAEARYQEYDSAIESAAAALGDLTAIELAEWMDENLAVSLTAEGWETLAESIRNVEQALDELGQHNQDIQPPPLPDAATASDTAITPDQLEDLRQQHRETYGQMAAEAEAVMKRAWGNIQDIAADALADILKTGKVDFKALANSILDIFAQMLAELLIKWAVNAAQRAALEQGVAAAGGGASAAGGAGGASSLWSSAKSLAGASTTALYVLGTVAVIAAVYALVDNYIDKKKSKLFGPGGSFVPPTEPGTRFTPQDNPSNDASIQVANQLGQAVQVVLDSFRWASAELDTLAIDIRNDGSRFRVTIADQVVGMFNSFEEALNFGVLQVFSSGTLTGLSDEVRAYLENNTANTVEEFAQGLQLAQEIADSALSDLELGLIERFRELQVKLRQADEFGIDGTKLVVDWGRGLQDVRDQITGASKDARQLFEEQRQAFNRQIEHRRAEAEAELARSSAAAAAAEVEIASIEARLAIFGAVTEAAASILASLNEQLGFAQAALASAQSAMAQARAILDNLPDPIAAGEFRNPGAGQRRRADRDRVQDFLRDHELSQLSDLAEAHARLNLQREELIRMAHGDAEAIAAVNTAIDEQIRLENQRAAAAVYGRITDFERDPDISPFREGIREVRSEARSISEDFLQLAEDLEFGAERIERGLDRIADAEERRLQSLVEQEGQDLLLSMLDFLGRSEESERLQFALAQAELLIRYEELKIAVERFGLELTVLDRIGELAAEIGDLDFEGWQRLRVATPTVNRFERSTNSAADAAQRMADRLARAKESIGDFLASLGRGEQGGVSTMEGLSAAQEQFAEVLAQARAGNIQAIEAFPEVSRNLLELAREAFASSPEFQDIFAQVQAAGLELLGINRVTQDNVIFDERFFAAQQQTTAAAEMGHARTTEAIRDGSDRQVSATREQTRILSDRLDSQSTELRGLSQSINAVLYKQERQKGAA